MPAELHLLRPQWLLALIPLAVLLWWLVRRPGAGDAWRGVVDAHLLAHLVERGTSGGRRLPLVLLAVGWTLAVLALAGPAWEQLPRPLFQTDARRVIALDISETMNAGDVPPSRLVRARFEVLDLLAQASEGQTALLAYGAEPFVVSPLTKDAQTIAAQVPDLVTDLLPVQGPARADLALALAGDLLARAGSQAGDVILVTGGLDDDGAARQAAADLRDRGYRVSVLGVGTEKGAPVPKADGGFVTDESGAILLPRLDPRQLADLASAGDGLYRTASADDSDTRALVPEAGPGSERAEAMDARADQWREEGPWLLLGVLVLAALAFRRGWLSPLVLVVLLLPHPPAQALDWEDLWLRLDQQAARAFAAGAHREAANQFRRPDWRAAAEYEAGDYADALDALQSLDGSEALYNRGNALARLGRLQDAIDEYERVLAGNPDHADARHNRDLLRDLLAQQEAQEPPSGGGEPPPEGEGGQGEGADDGGAGESDGGDTGGETGGGEGEGAEDSGSGAGGDGTSPTDPGGPPSEPPPGTDGQSGGEGQADATPEPEDGQTAGAGQAGADGPPPAAEAPAAAPGEAPPAAGSPGGGDGRQEGAGDEPDASDLLGEGAPSPGAVGDPSGQTAPGEQDQATEHLLRRVPDDPGGLLRQRFLLQHLRRSGRLP